MRAAKQLSHNNIELGFNDYRLAHYSGRAWEKTNERLVVWLFSLEHVNMQAGAMQLPLNSAQNK
jgi:hypothetical protein